MSLAFSLTGLFAVNRLKDGAERHFQQGNFSQAISDYTELYDSLSPEASQIELNLAHAHLFQKDTLKAKELYRRVMLCHDPKLRAIAHIQLGNLNFQGPTNLDSLPMTDRQKVGAENALNNFKNALRDNPENDIARYNLELLSRLLAKNAEAETPETSSNPPQAQPKTTADRLKEMELSPQEVEQIFQSLEQRSQQFLPMQPVPSIPQDPNLPDW